MLPPEFTDRPPVWAAFLFRKAIGTSTIHSPDSSADAALARAVAQMVSVMPGFDGTPPNVGFNGGPSGAPSNFITNPFFVCPIFRNGDAPGPYTYYAGNDASASLLVYYTLVALSATCYYEAWWDEVTTWTDSTGTAQSQTVNRHWVSDAELSVGGLCLPAGVGLPSGVPNVSDVHGVWPSSDEFAWQMPSSIGGGYNMSVQGNIANFRFTQRADYTPPIDGSANGFPA